MPRRQGFWIRLLAVLLDIVLFFPAYAGVWYAVTRADWYWSSDVEWVDSVLLASCWLIFTFTEVALAASPGKLILGLRIARADGQPGDRWRLFFRWSTKQFPMLCTLLYLISGAMPFYYLGGLLNFLLGIGFLYASNDDKQAWHDQWCGTAVFRRRELYTPQYAAFPVTPTPGPLPQGPLPTPPSDASRETGS